ncbi:MAG: CBS domain-containing protein [Nanoarchaeota archaeon]
MATCTVQDIMIQKVQFVKADDALLSIAEEMYRSGIGSVIVTLGGKPCGIITERDLAHHCVMGPTNIFHAKAKDIMSAPLVTIPPGTLVTEAARLMKEKNIKKVVVIWQNEILGIVTMTDIIHNIDLIQKYQGNSHLQVKDIMNQDLYYADSNDRVVIIAELMRRVGAGSLVIMENGIPIGILTERDLVKSCVLGEKNFFKIKTVDIFSQPIITIDEDAEILDAAKLMKARNIKKLVTTDNHEQITGIITQTDIVFNFDRIILPV